jgi:hypothetical protein
MPPYLFVVLSFVVLIGTLFFIIGAMDVDSDTPVGRSASELTHRRTARASSKVLVTQRNRRGRRGIRFRHEDQVALGISRHGVRTRRLGNFLDQDARSIDDAEHGASAERRAGGLGGGAGGGVIAIVALIEPDLIRAGDAAYLGIIMGFGVDDQSGRATRQVAGRAAEQEVVMQSDGGAVRSARVERDYAHILDRIVCSLHYRTRSELVWIGDQKAAAAGNRTGELPIIATRRIVGDGRDRCVKALGLRVPGGRPVPRSADLLRRMNLQP